MDTTRRVPGRAYQTVRDPERLLIEERAEALSAAGYPLPDYDPAMYAEQLLKEARATRRLPCSDICLSSCGSQGTDN